MQAFRIRDAADIDEIEARPYAAFMACASVQDALAEAAERHAGRPARTFIEFADPDIARAIVDVPAVPGGPQQRAMTNNKESR